MAMKPIADWTFMPKIRRQFESNSAGLKFETLCIHTHFADIDADNVYKVGPRIQTATRVDLTHRPFRP